MHFDVYTFVYWGCEAVVSAAVFTVLLVGFLRKNRYSPVAYPAGQLLLWIMRLLFQPSELGFELSYDIFGTVIVLCVLSALVTRFAYFGYPLAAAAAYMVYLMMPEQIPDIFAYFSLGGEYLFLGFFTLFSALSVGMIAVWGIYSGHSVRKQPKTN